MRSTPIFKILSAAVLAAVVVLLGVQTYRYFHRPLSVSAAYTSQVSDSISVTGWVVRQETALPEASGTLLRQVREGEKVHAGQTVAVSYASKIALVAFHRAKLVELHYSSDLSLLQKLLSEADENKTDDAHAVAAARIKREFADTDQRSLPCVQTQALTLLHAHTKEMEEKYGGQRNE